MLFCLLLYGGPLLSPWPRDSESLPGYLFAASKLLNMKQLIVLALCFGVVSASYAQNTKEKVYNSSGKTNYKHKKQTGFDPDRLILGGGMNLGFGGGYVNVGASPIVGYRISRQFSVGIGMGYQYYKEPTDIPNNTNTGTLNRYMNIYYPNLWARYFVCKNIFLNANYEYDFIRLKQPGYDNYGVIAERTSNVNNQCLLLGAGVYQPIVGRLGMSMELFYDVMQGQYSPYGGPPRIRLSIAAGF